ncbi:thioredoxin domain protein [Fibrisoma limi BUZ 3]|uniref:Thioredoxin domain protein n=1 Tax=Fibrisoma limi BUZ 3 TaxID=1185876 RepID=I2GB90_9BACT|nr:hypothetical protein [Fibrisoma limi]CCH51164.1 thioredoxin domain protein [Fibrisoma limi BUZ 3]
MQQVIDGQRQAIHAFRPEIPATALDERATAMRVGFYGTTRMFDKYRALVVPEAKRLMATPVDIIRKKDEANFNQFDSTQPDSVKHTGDYKQMAAMMKTAEAMQTATQLNNLAWSYYENLTDKTDLNQALAWSARSLELQRNGSFMDTYAHLLYKLGRKNEAVKVQQEAIALEKKAGNDTTLLEQALASMK